MKIYSGLESFILIDRFLKNHWQCERKIKENWKNCMGIISEEKTIKYDAINFKY